MTGGVDRPLQVVLSLSHPRVFIYQITLRAFPPMTDCDSDGCTLRAGRSSFTSSPVNAMGANSSKVSAKNIFFIYFTIIIFFHSGLALGESPLVLF